MAGLASAHALCLVPKEPGCRLSSCSKLFVQCWAWLWSPKRQDMGSTASPSSLCGAGLCFGPQRTIVWVQQLLQAFCAVLGFALVPKMPEWQLRAAHRLDPSADVLCVFCPSSPLVGHGVCMCTDASFPEGLLEFGDAAKDPEGQTPALRDVATHLVTLPAWHG